MSNPTNEVDANLVIQSLSAQVADGARAIAISEARVQQVLHAFEAMKNELEAALAKSEADLGESESERTDAEQALAERVIEVDVLKDRLKDLERRLGASDLS